ncbi:MAG TPA: hypothetical protein VMY37_07645, partial [Thermoguttaceae bacterium]|nr:hypothetical protein [Thermoguttaceae bacterium]
LPNAGKRRPPVDPAILTDPQWVWLSLPGGSALPDEICNDDDPLPLVAQQNGNRWLGLHVKASNEQRDDLRRRLAEAVDIEIRGEMLSAAKTPEARVAAIHDELPARPQHPDADVPMYDVSEWGGDVPAQWTAADFAPLDYWSLYRPGLFHPLDDRYAGPRLPIDEIVSRGVGWDGDVLFSALLLRECKYTRVEAEAALKASGSPWAAKLAEFMDERAVWEWEVFDGSWCPADCWPCDWHVSGDDWPVEVRIDGEGRRGRVGVVFRSYSRVYPDRLDLSDGFQRTQTVKRLAEAWKLPVRCLSWLDQRLAAEAITEKQAPDTRTEPDPQGQAIPTGRAAMLRVLDAYLVDQFTREPVNVVAVEKIGADRGTFKLVLGGGEKITLGPISKLTPANVRDAIEDAIRLSIPMHKKKWPFLRNLIVRLAELKDIGSREDDVAAFVTAFVRSCDAYATKSAYARGSKDWIREKYPDFGQSHHKGALFGHNGELLLHLPSFQEFCWQKNRELRQAELREALIELGFRGGKDAARLRSPTRDGKRFEVRAWIRAEGWVHTTIEDYEPGSV